MIDKRFLKEMPGIKPYITKQVAVQWLSLLCNIIFVALLADVFSHIFYKTVNEQLLLLTTCGIILYVVLRIVYVRKTSSCSYETSCHVCEWLRMRLFKKLLEVKSGYTESASTSELAQLSVEGTDQLEIYFGRYLPQLFYSMPASVTLFLILVQTDVRGALVLLLCVLLTPMPIIVIQESVKKLLPKYWSSHTTLGDSFLESLQGLITLEVYQVDEWEQREMNKEAENFRKITMKVLTMQLNSVSIMDLIAHGGAALDNIVAILGLQNGSLSLFQVICIVLPFLEFFAPLRLLGSFSHTAMNGIAAGDKIFRALDKPQKQVEQKQWKAETVNIQLRDSGFFYDRQRTILEHVYMQLRPGQFTVIVGESGSGKSIIVRLIAGVIKDYHGQLLIMDI